MNILLYCLRVEDVNISERNCFESYTKLWKDADIRDSKWETPPVVFSSSLFSSSFNLCLSTKGSYSSSYLSTTSSSCWSSCSWTWSASASSDKIFLISLSDVILIFCLLLVAVEVVAVSLILLCCCRCCCCCLILEWRSSRLSGKGKVSFWKRQLWDFEVTHIRFDDCSNIYNDESRGSRSEIWMDEFFSCFL